MEQHIFGVRDKIHIINLEHTVEMIKPAMKFIESVAAKNNKILLLEQKELHRYYKERSCKVFNALC